MTKTKEVCFEEQTFQKRLKSMLCVDFRRMFTMPFVYIMLGIAFLMPVLILIMTSAMDGTTSVNPTTNEITVITGFSTVWQIIGTSSSSNSAMAMDITSMCNINLIYFIAAVLVCIFVADDFRSGYAKNLFTVRSKKTDYVISKTLVCFVGGALMLILFFIGSMIGGAIAKISFDLGDVSAIQVVMCVLSKILLMAVFVPIYLVMSVFAKQKSWLSILCSMGASMLLFAMVPMITPLNATILNVILCVAGGAMFCFGLGSVSNVILKKTSLV